MVQLLQSYHGRLDLEALKSIQCDHADFPVGICRHYVEGTSPVQTRCAVLFKPVEGLMLLANGNPCEQSYTQFQVASYEEE
jgi:hypothetical protein